MAIDAQTLIVKAAAAGYSKLSLRSINEASAVVGGQYSFAFTNGNGLITWTDKNGTHNNLTLAVFNTTADFASVTSITINFPITISNLRTLPVLNQLIGMNGTLRSLYLAGNPLLTRVLVNSNSITSLNLTHNPVLTYLDVRANSLVALDTTQNPLLGTGAPNTIWATGNQLTVDAVNRILVNAVATGAPAGNINISSQTPAAPPSHGPPDGITAKATLIARGWGITTD
jgi:hypothetical protein